MSPGRPGPGGGKAAGSPAGPVSDPPAREPRFEADPDTNTMKLLNSDIGTQYTIFREGASLHLLSPC